jgi:uncharacterized protein involved in response to NO
VNLWNLGFRPFYLLASIFSAFSVLLWAAQFSGYLADTYLQSPLWHSHEMLFGYTTAIIAGVLLTAMLWAAAFGLYAIRYWPVLTRPRMDGKPG